MNHDNRTPLTLAVRCPVIFNTIVATGFRETVWQYGDSEMTLVSLYQVSFFSASIPPPASSLSVYINHIVPDRLPWQADRADRSLIHRHTDRGIDLG